MQSPSARRKQLASRRLARLATRQHGVVGGRQLRALGCSGAAITRMLAAGYLHRIHRGVYAVGHRDLSVRGRWMAAVLACHEGSVLSHRSAGSLHNVLITSARIEVIAHRPRRIPGLHVHTCRSLHPDDITTVDAIPTTTLERTLLDLAEVLQPRRLRDALEAAERLERLDLRRVEATVARNPGRHGIRPLRAALAELTGTPPPVRSQLERGFLDLVAQAGLPAPRVNVLLHDELVDCFWPDVPLVVEIDSFHFHRSRRSFEDNRRRDAKLAAHRIPVVRFTDQRLEHEPAQVIDELRRLLSDRAG